MFPFKILKTRNLRNLSKFEKFNIRCSLDLDQIRHMKSVRKFVNSFCRLVKLLFKHHYTNFIILKFSSALKNQSYHGPLVWRLPTQYWPINKEIYPLPGLSSWIGIRAHHWNRFWTENIRLARFSTGSYNRWSNSSSRPACQRYQ